MTTSSSLPSFPSTLSWSKDDSTLKVKYSSSVGPYLVGRSKLKQSPLFYLSLSPFSTAPYLPSCCMSHSCPSTGCPTIRHLTSSSSSSSSLCRYRNRKVDVKQNICLTGSESCAFNTALILTSSCAPEPIADDDERVACVRQRETNAHSVMRFDC